MKKVFVYLPLLLATGPAWGQAAPAKPLATRDEYRTCLRMADEAVERRASLQKRKADFDEKSRQLSEDMNAYRAAGDAIKKGSAAADAYNANGDKLNARAAALNLEADQFDKDIAVHNRVSAEASKQCSGLTVSSADSEAVAKERAAAGKK